VRNRRDFEKDGGILFWSGGRDTDYGEKYLQTSIPLLPPGDAEAVLRALDAFGREEFLMNVGDEKGRFLISVIQEAQPKVVIELG
jgi:predicted O-methyltransferase YrrM